MNGTDPAGFFVPLLFLLAAPTVYTVGRWLVEAHLRGLKRLRRDS